MTCHCVWPSCQNQRECLVVPPSLSLPRKGGGNVVAPLCPSPAPHAHVAPRCVHALALPRGRAELRGNSNSAHLALGKERPSRLRGLLLPISRHARFGAGEIA